MLKELKTTQIHIGDRHRKDMGDLTAPADKIRQEGLLQPIEVTDKLELVFGERPIWPSGIFSRRRPSWPVDVTSILVGEFHENEVRKDCRNDKAIHQLVKN